MTPRSPESRRRHRPAALAALLAGGATLIAALAIPAFGQPPPSSAASRPEIATQASRARPTPAEDGIRWHKLKPAQRESLKPLQQEWSGIDAARKQKWLQLADRMPGMPPDERARVQARMSDWTRLTPTQRGQVRLQFQEAKQIPSPDRRSRWEAYQALSAEQKRELADRAAATRAQDAASVATSRRPPTGVARGERGEKATRDGTQAKSNIVPNPAYSAPPRAIGPTYVQAGPGATTTLVTRRPVPPAHQHVGLPKIAATPEFVDKSTLLPQRGPQGAAIRPVPAGDAPPNQR